MAITIHYMTDDFQCESMLWDVPLIKDAALTSDVIKETVEHSLSGALDAFSLVSIVTDNG
jgi:hypothetical protein